MCFNCFWPTSRDTGVGMVEQWRRPFPQSHALQIDSEPPAHILAANYRVLGTDREISAPRPSSYSCSGLGGSQLCVLQKSLSVNFRTHAGRKLADRTHRISFLPCALHYYWQTRDRVCGGSRREGIRGSSRGSSQTEKFRLECLSRAHGPTEICSGPYGENRRAPPPEANVAVKDADAGS